MLPSPHAPPPLRSSKPHLRPALAFPHPALQAAYLVKMEKVQQLVLFMEKEDVEESCHHLIVRRDIWTVDTHIADKGQATVLPESSQGQMGMSKGMDSVRANNKKKEMQ